MAYGELTSLSSFVTVVTCFENNQLFLKRSL